MIVTEIRNKNEEVVVKVRVVESNKNPDVRIVQVVEMRPCGLESLKYSKVFEKL